MAIAYFITFTTYGTWLHGTDKGKGSVDRDHNRFGSSFVAPDEDRQSQARHIMTEPPYVMDSARRQVVQQAIMSICVEKSWRLWAVHIRSNHAHIVISADREPGRLMSDLKARASRDLNAAGLDTPQRTRWTRHGSTKHLFNQAQLDAAIRYTLDGQGSPMQTHDGRQEPRTK